MFRLLKSSKHFLSKEETEDIMKAVRENEQGTSGEIRIFIESHCRYMDPVQRAGELFYFMNMNKTVHRNGVLIYIADQDRDFALFGDVQLHQKVGDAFWRAEVKSLARHFHQNDRVQGIKHCIKQIGDQLKLHFPLHGENRNELPDEIMFGK